MRLSRFAAGALVCAFVACSVVNSPDDPIRQNNDVNVGGSPPEGCPEGFVPCGNACVVTANDPQNCGSCGTTCEATEVCGMGQCLTSAQGCPTGTEPCGQSCVDLQGDVANCGACGRACPAGANATAGCSAGACTITCGAGFDDCDEDATDCEQDIQDDVDNCGACGTRCIATANSSVTCSGGTCAMAACDAGFDDCDNNPATGCEANLNRDPMNCTQCNMACTGGNNFCLDGCINLFWQSGVQQNLPIANLVGWQQCYLESYNNGGTPTSTVLSACSGDVLLMGCRVNGSPTLAVAAMGFKEDVTFDCGGGVTDCDLNDCTRVANGVGWYWNDQWSIGFVQGSEPVDRCSCDVAPSLPNTRVCWHAGGGAIQGGYRCGSAEGVGPMHERIMFHHP